MKRFWTALSVLAIAAAGAWYFKDRLPLDQVPYLKQFASVSPRADAETATQPSQSGQPARQQGQRQGGGRRNGGPPTVSTIAVGKATLPMDATATGWAVAADITNIAPLQAGLVMEIEAKDGQHIKAGDLILKMDDRIARAAVDKDKANIAADQATLEQTEAAFQRAANLVKQSAESQQVLDQARAAPRSMPTRQRLPPTR
jgi:membrane fusion protein, multidrug efflux system